MKVQSPAANVGFLQSERFAAGGVSVVLVEDTHTERHGLHPWNAETSLFGELSP